MNAISTILTVAWKELRLIIKDVGYLAILFLLPLLLGSVVSASNAAIAGTDDEDPTILLKAGLVNEDGGIFGNEIARVLKTIDELDLEIYDTTAEAEAVVAKGDVAAAVIIPASFSDDINSYTPTQIDVIIDPAQTESSSIVTGIMKQVVTEVALWGEVQYGVRTALEGSGIFAGASPEQMAGIQAQTLGAIMTQLNELRSNPVIAVVSENVEGEDTGSWLPIFFTRVFAGFSVMFMFFIVGVSAQSLLKEREAGTLRRLIASPVPRWMFIAGKTLAYMALACLQVIILFTVAAVVFDVPMGNSPLALVITTLVTALTASSMGMLVAALAKSAKQADSIGTVLGLVLAGISGALPVTAMPATRIGGFMNIISRLTPQGNGVEAFFSIMSDNASLVQVLPELGVLLGMSVVFFIITSWRFSWE